MERTFWIPLFGAALFLTPLVGSAVASSFPVIEPRPLANKEAFAAVTPLPLRLDNIEIAPVADEEIGEIEAPAEAPAPPRVAPAIEPMVVTEEEAPAPYVFGEHEGWRARVISHALALMGRPYHWGGTQPGGFDCSGLVQYVMADVGIVLPRTMREMLQVVRPVTELDLRPGDLVFFRSPDHVGIYLGNGEFIHASSGKRRVTISSLVTDRFYQRRYIGSGRVAD